MKAAGDAADPYREYYFVEQIVTDINKDCLEIKKWSVTAASAIAVVGQVGPLDFVLVLPIIALLALIFWITEAVWRINQWAFIRHIRELEAKVPEGPQISTRWGRFYFGEASATGDYAEGEWSRKRAWTHFWAPRTALPHIIIVALALGLMLFDWTVGLVSAPPPAKPQRIEGSLDVRLHPGLERPR